MPFTNLKSTPFVVDVDEWDIITAERARLNYLANAFRVSSLGGARHVGIDGDAVQDVIDFQEIELDGDLLAGYTIRARVEVKTADAGTTVQPRIFDVTDNSVHIAGTASNSLTWAKQNLVFTLPAAVRSYKLQVVKSNSLFDVFAIGYLELKAP